MLVYTWDKCSTQQIINDTRTKLHLPVTIVGVWDYAANMTGFSLLWLVFHDLRSWLDLIHLVPLTSSPPWERDTYLPTTHDVQLLVSLSSSPPWESEKHLPTTHNVHLLVPLSFGPPWEREREKHFCYDSWRPSTSPLVLQSAMTERGEQICLGLMMSTY